MFTSANEQAAIERTARLIQQVRPSNMTLNEIIRDINYYVRAARREPGVRFMTGGISYVHYIGDGTDDPNDWSETKISLDLAEFLRYGNGVEQQFVHVRGDELHESVPDDWK